jgi:hypothetical protein
MAKKTTRKPTKKPTKKTAKKTATKKTAPATKAATKSATAGPVAKKAPTKAANKTAPTERSVEAYLASVDEAKRADCERLVKIIGSVVKEPPRMWGPSIVGFGSYHYKYDSGREGDWTVAGFSARASAITVYIMSGFDGEPDLMAKLGKYKTGKSCLYIKSLADVDEGVLKELVKRSVAEVRRRYPG